MLPAAMKVAIVCVGKLLLGTPTATLAAVLLVVLVLLLLPLMTLAAVVDESMKPLRLPDGSAAPKALYKS